MKYFALSMVSALAFASLGSGAVARPFPQTQAATQQQPASQSPLSQQQFSESGSAGGYAGSASETQNNDYSQVAPGNQVMNGGGQSAELQGLAGTVFQTSKLGSLFQRRQSDRSDDQQASAAGYDGTSASYQNNDDSAVAPGNYVQLGGSSSASNQGVPGKVSQVSDSAVKRTVPTHPISFLDLLGQDGHLPTKILARDADSSSNGVYLASTQFGPVDGPDDNHKYGVPHYMGLGPVVRPAL